MPQANAEGDAVGASGAAVSGKKKIRCRHFPNCTNTECPFIHPTEDCKFFPACTNGDRCIYIHPEVECKFGAQCTR